MRRDRMSAAGARQTGSSLIEVLVAVTVLSIGLLGVASLQALGVQSSNSAYLRTQANVMAMDILDRMRVNADVARAGGYEVAIGTATIAGASIAADDISAWKTALSASLPGGDGSVDACPSSKCTVTVQWTDSDGEGGFATRSISLESRL